MSVPTSEIGYTLPVSLQQWSPTPDPETTPELRWPYSIEVFDQMRKDAQVKSVLRAVSLPILRTPWRIAPNSAPAEVVEFVADNLGLPVQGQESRPALRTRDRFSWPVHLRHALLMLTYGASIFEQVYRIAPDGRAWLRKLGWRPPATISKINVAPDGGLVSIEQTAVTGQTSVIPVDRLVAYVNEREGGNWLGQSLLRAAYRPWLLKDRSERLRSIMEDRNGMGVPVYEAGSDPVGVTGADLIKYRADQVKAGQALAKQWRSGENAGAAVPAGAKMSLVGVTGTLPDLDTSIRYHDEQIARAVLAHFLNLGTETGSWALGKTFADFFTLSLQAVADDVADVTTAHVIEDLVDVNFGPDVPAPAVVADEIGSALTAQAVQQLVSSGVIRADDPLEEFVRNSYGLPPADPSSAREPIIMTPTGVHTPGPQEGQ